MIHVSTEEFEGWVAEGIEAIEPRYRAHIENVAVVIDDVPSLHQRKISGAKDGLSLYGLYEGIPLTERGESYMFSLPDKITIFKDAILDVAETPEEARLIIANTVWHEFGHYFGLGEEEIHHREVKEGRDLF
jgi:predicted Zn-dependent protease with MMP-like domain